MKDNKRPIGGIQGLQHSGGWKYKADVQRIVISPLDLLAVVEVFARG